MATRKISSRLPRLRITRHLHHVEVRPVRAELADGEVPVTAPRGTGASGDDREGGMDFMRAMKVLFSANRRRLAFTAALTVFAMLTFTGDAFASVPGESGYWTTETAQGSQVYSQGPVREAYQTNGTHLDVWRGQSNNTFWVSYGNSTIFTLGSASTQTAPTVVAFGSGGFAVFYVGTDGTVYWNINLINSQIANPNYWSGWRPAGHDIVTNPNQSVDVVQLGASTTNLYMIWRGSGDDLAVFGSYFGGDFDSSWEAPVSLGGSTYNAPAITFNPQTSVIWAAATGTDGNLWLNTQDLGSGVWDGWQPVHGGPVFSTAPAIAAPTLSTAGPEATQMMVVADVSLGETGGSDIFYNVIDPYGNAGGWVEDPTGWQTTSNVTLDANQNGTIYAQLNGENGGDDWWQQIYQPGSGS